MIAYLGPELAKAHRTVRRNTLQIAQEIPEEKYSFAPAPGTRTVAELLTHIAFTPALPADFHREKRVSTLQGYDFVGFLAPIAAEEKKPRTKAQILELLETEGERFASWLETLTPEFLAETFTDGTGQNPRTRFENLLSAKEHEMHHRGQLMQIQRMLGLVPHLTRQRQQQAASRGHTGAV